MGKKELDGSGYDGEEDMNGDRDCGRDSEKKSEEKSEENSEKKGEKKPVKLVTERLVLRPWQVSDAQSLYAYANDPQVGPAAGWPVHTSVADSRRIIRELLSDDETYAVVPRVQGEERAVGSIGLMIGEKSDLGIAGDEAEIGYWIGRPFWGQGLIPEAVERLMAYAFETLGMTSLWCGYFAENEKSKRVQEKCGFRYHHTRAERLWPLINEPKTEHVTRLTREEWRERRDRIGES